MNNKELRIAVARELRAAGNDAQPRIEAMPALEHAHQHR